MSSAYTVGPPTCSRSFAMRIAMRRAPFLLALVALTALPSLAQAQRGLGGLRGRAAGVMAAAQDASVLGTILTHKDELKLSADQVTKIRRIDSTTTAANAPTMEKVRALRADSANGGAQRPAQMTQEQRALAAQKLRDAAPLLKEVAERNAKAADEARGLLSQEQKDALQKLVDEQAGGRGRGRRRPER
jgi:hypothetical protein